MQLPLDVSVIIDIETFDSEKLGFLEMYTHEYDCSDYM